jgi:hypothetical protein
MKCVPVPDWKTGWEVSTILEALRECYPLAALDNQNNIALTRKQFSEQLISAMADFGYMPADSEAQLLSKFEQVFTNFHNNRKEPTKRCSPTSIPSKKHTRADAPSNPDHLKATVGKH